MAKFSDFADEELDAMAEACCIQKLSLLAEEIRKERGSTEKNTECTFNMPPHMEPDNCGNYVVMSPTVDND
jgi:hypothetical protein